MEVEASRLEFSMMEPEIKTFRSCLRSMSKIGAELMIQATPNEASDQSDDLGSGTRLTLPPHPPAGPIPRHGRQLHRTPHFHLQSPFFPNICHLRVHRPLSGGPLQSE